MTNKQPRLSVISTSVNLSARLTLKPAISALSLSLLLTLSACSGDNTTEEIMTTTEAAEAEPVAIEEQASAPVDSVLAEDTDTAPSTDTVTLDQQTDTDAAAEPELLAASAGAELYEQQCKICHESGLLNAPRYGNKAAWSAALAKDKQTLYMHSAQGFNQMPAQAVNGVSEAQVAAAVDYMLAAVD